jgi:tetratricopeptide (TPR) repeat protein
LAYLPFWRRLPASLGLFGYAVSRLLWPAGLSPDYSAVSFPFGLGWAWGWSWVGLACALAILGYSIMNYLRGGRGWLLASAGAIGYGLIANGPLLIGVDLAERLWYWPSAAACLALGWGAGRVHERLNPGARRTAALGFGLALVLLLSAAWAGAPAWRSPKDYALATLSRFPECWRAHVNLAREYYLEKDFERGAQQARQATAIFPDLAIGWDWLGVNAMFVPGAEREAETALRRALALDPSLQETHRHLANLLERLGRKAEAARELEEYLKFSDIPDRPKVAERLRQLRKRP